MEQGPDELQDASEKDVDALTDKPLDQEDHPGGQTGSGKTADDEDRVTENPGES